MKQKNSSFTKLLFNLFLIVAFLFGVVESRFLYNEETIVEIRGTGAKCLIENCLQCKQAMPYTCKVCSPEKSCCSPYCKTCSQADHLTCQQCQTGYSYNETSRACYITKSCYQGNCIQCFDNEQCEVCGAGTAMNPYTQVCTQCPDDCSSCDYLGQCTACEFHKYLVNGKCLNCDDNCRACKNGKNYCTQCEMGKYLVIASHTCQDCMINCTKCDSAAKCTQCKGGFFFNDKSGRCELCGQYCLLCKSVAQCIQCADGYYLNKATKFCNTCNQIIPNCQICRNNTELMNGNKQRNWLGASGQIKETNVSCIECQAKFMKTDDNTCVACVAHCLSCVKANECVQCSYGFVLNDQTKLCEVCNIIHCILCKTTKQCYLCSPGFFWNNITHPTFFYCDKCHIGCVTCGINYCTHCDRQYYLSNNTCLRCSSQCASCQGPYNCTGCNIGYYAFFNSNRCFKCPQECLRCESVDKCNDCALGFRLDNYQCLKCNINGCGFCNLPVENGQETCLNCISSFFLKDNRCYSCIQNCYSCQNQSTCNQCNQGFYLDLKYTCSPCSQHCSSCQTDLERSIINCNLCQNGYYIENSNTCKKCTTQNCLKCQKNICFNCAHGYYIQGNTCSPCPLNCTQCGDEKTCWFCQIGFYLSKNFTCTPCKEGCSYCNDNQSCLVCAEGYWLDKLSSTCKACQATNCALCSLNGEHCDKCYPGFKLQQSTQLSLNQNSSSICFKCGQESLLGCSQCQSSTKCTQCIENYEMNSNNLCEKQSYSTWPFILTICLLSITLLVILVIKIKHKFAGKSLSQVLSTKKQISNPQNYHRLQQLSLN